MITRVEGPEIRTKKRVKGWAGWTPRRGARAEAALCEAEDGEGLVLLNDRLVKAAVEIKATTTSSRNRKFLCA